MQRINHKQHRFTSGSPSHWVWRHTCTVVDFISGRTSVVENGRIVSEIISKDLVRMYKVRRMERVDVEIILQFPSDIWLHLLSDVWLQFPSHVWLQLSPNIWLQHITCNMFHHTFDQTIHQTVDKTMNSVSAGCNYRAAPDLGAAYMTMHGESDRLPDVGLRPVRWRHGQLHHTCQKFKQGNLIDWETTNWYLNSSKGTAVKEEMDLQMEICQQSSTSLVYVPYKMTFDPAGLHLCSKFSGQVASYSVEDELKEITQ